MPRLANRNRTMNRIEVCFSPGEYHLYEADFQLVVVLDVLRATSAICTAMEHGVKEIIPVATVDEARALQAEGYLAAAERGGQIVEGFDLGNSPYSYMEPSMKGQTVVLTTTNGTKAINMAKNKETVVIGSLNNLDALCDWLVDQGRDILVLGSGWKDKFNLEDTICAGAIADKCLEVWQVLRRRRQHGGGQVHLPLFAGQHVRVPQGVLPSSPLAQAESERRREVLLDAQQLHRHPHSPKRFLGSHEP